MTPTTRQRLLGAAAILGGWTFIAVLFGPQTYILNQRAPTPLTWWQSIAANMAIFYVWAVLTPVVIHLGRRYAFERPHFGRSLAVHFAASFALSAVHLVLLRYVNIWLMGGASSYRPPVPVMALVVGYGATNIMIYWSVVAIGQALTYFRRYQEREFRLVEAQLQSLRTQLHPHFLFNTLNAIAELVYHDAARAERTVTQLSDLLRLALKGGQEEEVPLAQELDFLRNYLAIQETLLQERLTVRWDVDDEALSGLVPAMILQPLAENAIQHGIAPRLSGGTLSISARHAGGTLHLTVEDDGVGIGEPREQTDPPGSPGVGLPNTRARLHHLYGGAHDFQLATAPGGRGVAVRVALPFREGTKGDR